MCTCGFVIWKVVFGNIFCNGSRLYKNVYKMFYLFENVLEMEVLMCKKKNSVSKRVTKSESIYSKGLKCSFLPPLDVAILPLIW